MKNGKYTAEDIDEKVLRYVDAYIKQTLRYTKVDYIKESSNERKYTDLLKKRNDGFLKLVDAESDRYIYEKIQIDDYIIEFESETVFREIMRLTEKQREVLLKNVVLGIPMEEIARQMGIRENKVYKHKKNALLALAERMKPDEL